MSSGTLGADTIDNILNGAQELAKEYEQRLEKEYSGLGWRQRHVSDHDHALWFYMMATENPNWVAALQYVEGGLEEMKRFMKTTGMVS